MKRTRGCFVVHIFLSHKTLIYVVGKLKNVLFSAHFLYVNIIYSMRFNVVVSLKNTAGLFFLHFIARRRSPPAITQFVSISISLNTIRRDQLPREWSLIVRRILKWDRQLNGFHCFNTMHGMRALSHFSWFQIHFQLNGYYFNIGSPRQLNVALLGCFINTESV